MVDMGLAEGQSDAAGLPNFVGLGKILFNIQKRDKTGPRNSRGLSEGKAILRSK